MHLRRRGYVAPWGFTFVFSPEVVEYLGYQKLWPKWWLIPLLTGSILAVLGMALLAVYLLAV